MYSTHRNCFELFVRVGIVFMLLISLGLADYDADGVELTGRNPYGYCPFAVASGDYVYAASGTVFEVLGVDDLLPVGQVITESIVSSIAISGNYAYIANWSDGFKVIDISDPTDPTLVAQIDFEGQCWDLSVSGDYAYLGNNTEGLQIIDISDPLLPSLASTFLPVETPAFEYTQVVDTIAYAASQSGLYILNVSDPAAPVQLGYAPSENGAWSVHVVDTIAYLPKGADGIRMINVADPTTPLEIGYFPTPDGALWVEVVDTIAYVAERYAGIQILDISDLTAPDSSGMFEVDYADAINIQGDSLYLASSIGGIKLIDISDLISPVLLNENSGGGYALDVYTSGEYTYVSHRNMGVGVYHISEEGSLLQVGYIELGAPYKLSGRGSNLYVADGGNLQIIDVSDPANPQIINTWNEGWVNNVIAYRSLLYLVGSPDLQIINAGDPNNLELLGSLDGLPSSPYELALNNGFLYLASRSGGLNIVDVRDSASPQHISNLGGFSYTWSVAVSGKYAYVADRDNGEVRAIDVSNPEEPFDAGGIAIGSRVEDVQVSGRFVYGLDAWEGVRIIDFADPINPLEVGYFNTGGFSKGLYNDWGWIAVADGGGGLYLLETYIQSPNFTVNSIGDESDTDPGDGNCDVGNGDCTLRAAIEEANAYPGYNIIWFDIPGEGPHYIQPQTELPAVEDPVDINGRSEPDWAGNPSVAVQGMNAGETNGIVFRPSAAYSRMIGMNVSGFSGAGVLVEGNGHAIIWSYIGTDITGSTSQANGIGIDVMGSYNQFNVNTVSGNSATGINLIAIPDEGFECHHNGFQGNKIGTDAAGGYVVPNDGDGMYIGEETHHNVIGNGNVIAGNTTRGIWLSGTWENVIQGNLIGTDASGTVALGNGSDQHGIVIGSGSHHNVIGGQFETEGNVISGHDGFGVALWNEGTQFNQILGNKIGVDVTGEAALGNAWCGIFVTDNVNHVEIGGLEPGLGNLIANNGDNGIELRGWNVSILSNSIYNNEPMGIVLGFGDPIPNDPADSDGGFNNIQNYPEIDFGTVEEDGDLMIRYKVDSSPTYSTYPLTTQFFLAEPEPTPQGKFLLYTDEYSDEDFDAGFKTIVVPADLGFDIGFGAHLVATATDAEGNSSQFSPSWRTNGSLFVDATSLEPGDQQFFYSFMPFTAGLNLTVPIRDNAENEIAVVELFDDGAHGDQQANDQVFGNFWTIPADVEQHYLADLNITLDGEDIYYEDMARFTTTGPLTLTELIGVNPDFPNPGDRFRFHIELLNQSDSVTVPDVAVRVVSIDARIHSPEIVKHCGDIVAGEVGRASYMTVDVLAFELDEEIEINLGIEILSQGHHFWTDSVTFRLFPVGVDAKNLLPEVYSLRQNYPNPFNPTTTISYGLPESSDVSLVIYDLKGRVVQSYTEQDRPAGWVHYEWNGTNANGKPVGTGIYLCRMVAGQYTKTIKMIYLQ